MLHRVAAFEKRRRLMAECEAYCSAPATRAHSKVLSIRGRS